jgi:hypothetical protein
MQWVLLLWNLLSKHRSYKKDFERGRSINGLAHMRMQGVLLLNLPAQTMTVWTEE